MVVDHLGHLCKVSTTTIGKVRHLYSLGSLLEQDSAPSLGGNGQARQFSPTANPNLQLQCQGNQSSNTDFPSNQPPRAPCQICGKTSHSALDCFHRMDYAYQGRHPPPQLDAMVAQTNSTFEEQPWFADNSANAHITRDMENLSIQPQPFQGPESVAVGNGAGLTIEHTGSTIFHSPSIPFYLKHVLHCPTATANLLSIQKFCQDNNCYFVLTSSHYFVKDLRTHALLLEGRSENGLYPLKLERTSSKNAPVFSAFLGIKASTLMWHSRLGHPSFSTVKNVIKAHSLPLLNNDINKEHFCDFCQLGKSKQLPFTTSTRSTTFVLDLIHTDLWTSPVPSISGCKYYIIFVDDFTRYTWLYPLHFKSDAYHCFVKFKMLVENQFSCKIKQLQSDGGGEYTSNLFLSFLSNNGIQHRKSCPHTSQQNGLAKRKLRHILETGLTILAHSGLSNRYWVDAFLTSVFIINRLPTPVLDHMSPYERLFHKSPDYSLLRVFGCKGFPLLRPYTAHKLEFRSKACVFLGYSHAGYRCLDPVTNRVYLSRNVTFDEQSFPAKDHAHLQLPSKINDAFDGPFQVQVSSPISSTLSLPTYTPHATVAPSISTDSVSNPHNITSPPIAAPDSALPIDLAPDPCPLIVSSPVADSLLPTLAPAPLEPAVHPVSLDNPTVVPSPTVSILASFCVWTKSLICKDAANRDSTVQGEVRRISKLPVSLLEDESSRLDAHLSTVPFVRTTCLSVRTSDRQASSVRKTCFFCPDTYIVSRSFCASLLRPDDSAARPNAYQFSNGSLILSKFQEREDQSTVRTMWYPVRTSISVRQESQFKMNRLDAGASYMVTNNSTSTVRTSPPYGSDARVSDMEIAC
jgi:transposase InsO family protein